MVRVFKIQDCSYQPAVSSEDYETVFWLGAGFSKCVTKGQAPLMRGFFVGINGAKYPHLHRYLSARCASVENANVEEVLQAVEQMEDCPLPPRLRHAMLSGQNPSRIKEELELFTIERLTFDEIDAEHWPVELMAQANHRTTVVTTNYDTVAEMILSSRAAAQHCGVNSTCHHCNMRAILAEDCACDVNNPGPAVGGRNASLLKLHGSTAWHVCVNTACGITDCLIASCNCSPCAQPKCDCCGDQCRPVIVLPSMRKTFSRYPLLGRMWERAHDALRRCKTFTVFGFSFPQSDCLVCDVVGNALMDNLHLQDIIIIDVEPSRVAERILSVLPSERDLSVVLCEVPRDGSVPEWWPKAVAAENPTQLIV